jgi:hypothetical protein
VGLGAHPAFWASVSNKNARWFQAKAVSALFPASHRTPRRWRVDRKFSKIAKRRAWFEVAWAKICAPPTPRWSAFSLKASISAATSPRRFFEPRKCEPREIESTRVVCEIHFGQSQRDCVLQPRVGAERLPWDVCEKEIPTPTGLSHWVPGRGNPFRVENDLGTLTQGSLESSATLGLRAGIPLGFCMWPRPAKIFSPRKPRWRAFSLKFPFPPRHRGEGGLHGSVGHLAARKGVQISNDSQGFRRLAGVRFFLPGGTHRRYGWRGRPPLLGLRRPSRRLRRRGVYRV